MKLHFYLYQQRRRYYCLILSNKHSAECSTDPDSQSMFCLHADILLAVFRLELVRKLMFL